MNRLGIEFLSALGLPPVEYLRLAAELGCAHASIALRQSPVNPLGYADFDLAADTRLRREVIAALRDTGVSFSLGEGFAVAPGRDIRDSATPQFEPLLELGVRRLNVISWDPDLARTHDQYALLCDLATAAGFDEIVCEFAPGLAIRDLKMGVAALRHVGRPNFRLLIDTMHFGRTGGTGSELAALDPKLIGYVQLSDVPRRSTQNYLHEAMRDRKAPGDGELPLFEMLAAIPRDRVVSLEVPQEAKALAGQTPKQILEPVVAATRALLERLPTP